MRSSTNLLDQKRLLDASKVNISKFYIINYFKLFAIATLLLLLLNSLLMLLFIMFCCC
jgi:hypothetical protein